MDFIMAQDSAGKVTGTGSMYVDLGIYAIPDIYIPLEIIGKVKGSKRTGNGRTTTAAGDA